MFLLSKGGGVVKPWIDLKKLRKERGWTQLQTANALGFCRSYISAVERGRQGFSIEMVNVIMGVFDIRYEEFYNSRFNK